jgi:hypothetical protein
MPQLRPVYEVAKDDQVERELGWYLQVSES